LETELNSRTYTLESDLEKERIAIRAREEKVRKWESRHAAEEPRHIPRLRRGMDFNQVDALLGRPEMFFNHANVDEWIYGCLADGKYSVWFYSGVLDGATRTDDCEGPPSGEIKPIEYFVTELLDKLDGVKE
jgi:hypothetical protein